MVERLRSGERGQALVEFALIIGVLLAIIFLIIEGGRTFQAWQTVQNAARVGARYALTGQFDTACLEDFTCDTLNVRTVSIQRAARAAAAGLEIDDSATPDEPAYFFVSVTHRNDAGDLVNDAAPPGKATTVSVLYNVRMLTPIFQAIANRINLFGQVEAITEDYNQESPAQPPDVLPIGDSPGVPPTPPSADLELTKSVSPSIPAPLDPSMGYVGDDFLFSILVTNLGPFDTPNVVVVDELPNHTITPTNVIVSRGGVPLDGASCTVDQIEVNCSIPYMDGGGGPDSQALITFNAAIAPSIFDDDPLPTSKELTNTATAFNPPVTVEPDPSNNSWEAPFTVLPWGDLEMVSKTGPLGSLPIMTPFVYELVVRNHGPNTAKNVKVKDDLPNGLTYIPDSWSGAGVTVCNPDIPPYDVVCNLEPLAAGQTVTLSLGVEATHAGNFLNTATVFPESGFEKENNYTNSQSTSTNITAPDITVSKELAELADPSTRPTVGNDFIYRLTVRNMGTATASGVILTDTLDGNLNYVGSDDASCTEDTPNRITCQHQGDLAPGGGTWTVNIFVNPIAVGSVSNLAEVSTVTPEYDVLPNNASLVVDVWPINLVLVKSQLTDSEIPIGETIRYRITVDNVVPSGDATNLVLTDSLPPSFDIVSYSAVAQDCVVSEDINPPQFTISCLEYDVDDPQIELNIEVSPTITGTFTNNSDLVADYFGPVNDSESTTVIASADLSVSKTAPLTVTVGLPITYTIMVTNAGPSMATNVTLTDNISRTVGNIHETFDANLGQCNVSLQNEVECFINEMAVGTFTFTISAIPSIPGTYMNTVSIASDIDDPDNSNNLSEEVDTVAIP